MNGGDANNQKENSQTASPILEFKRLTAQCGRDAFSCGEHEIDNWFREECLKDHGNLKMRTVIARELDTKAITGFYALRLQSERLSELKGKSRLNPFVSGGYVPVVRVCWVAVRSDVQRRGFGTVIMGSVLKEFHEIVLRTGLSFLTLSALNRKTSQFYQKLGFQHYGPDTAYPAMFLTARAVIELLGDEDGLPNQTLLDEVAA